MSIPILRIRGEDGLMHDVLAFRGPKGDSYVLTTSDKTEIAQIVLASLPNGDTESY